MLSSLVTITGSPTSHLRLLLLVLPLSIFSTYALAATDPEKVEDWTVSCKPAKDKDKDKESCVMYMLMVEPENRRPVFKVQIGYLSAAKSPYAMFVLPLGVKVGAGLQLRIDKAEPINFPFEACSKDGCTAFLKLDKAVMKILQEGSKVTFVFINKQAKPVGIDISLKGFSAALKKVK